MFPALRDYVTRTPWALEPSSLILLQHGGDLAEIMAAAAPQRPTPVSQGKVAVLPLWGVLAPRSVSSLWGSAMGLDSWMSQFAALDADPNVATIILSVDSPGGAVDLVPEAAAMVRGASTRTVAVADTRAASAAYWIASAADELVVSPSGAVGSVGVYAAHEDMSRQLDALGVTVTLISAGDHKVDGNPFEPLSDEARATIQENVDAYYGMFVGDVAKGRNADVGFVEANFGQGKMMMAADAVRVGMADRIGTLDDTITRLLDGKPATRRPSRAAELVLNYTQPALTFSTASASTSGGITFTGPKIFMDSGTDAGNAAPAATTTQGKEIHVDGTASNRDELVARRDEIEAAMTELHTKAPGRAFNDTEQVEFDQLTAEATTIDAAVKNIDQREARLEFVNSNSPESVVEAVEPVREPKGPRGGIGSNVDRRIPENPFALQEYGRFAKNADEFASVLTQGALHIADGMKFDAGHGDKTEAHDHVERVLRTDEDAEFAKRVILTANPAYDRAFGKAIMRGRDSLSSHEDSLIRAAITEAGLGSETPVPITIDPTVMLISNGQTNPLRAVADVRTITGLTWRGITSQGITAAYEASESAQVADGSPTFGGGDISVLRVDAYVPFSIEVDMDWPALRSELALEFADSKDVLEGVKFFTGSGTNEPTGLITALTAATALVKTATTAVFAYTDPKLASNALPVRWDSGAQWFAAKAVWSDLADLYAAAANSDPFSFAAMGAAGQSQTVRGNAGGTYRGYPMNYASAMDTAVTTSGKNIMVIGDPRAYTIVDRIGMNVELIPHVMGTSNRPIGQRGLYAYWRNNANIRTVNAFQILQVK